VASDAQWASLVDVLGAPTWAKSDALVTHVGRRAAHDAIDAELRPWIAERDRGDLVRELLARGIPAAPVADSRRAREDAQLQHRGFFERFDHPVVGTHFAPSVPFRYASVSSWLRTAAPTLGQHNREVLRDLCGYSEDEIDVLEEEGVIGQHPEGL
jgi:crotonobetainyl-CoA:carnitine CoA-transferase CaiB-like acyl-CoA transferase